MGVVYLAIAPGTQKHVAIKWLKAHGPEGVSRLQRFQREAEVLSRLSHVNIAALIEYSGAEAKDQYLVTEFVYGISMRTALAKKGSLTASEVVYAVCEICKALDCAHSAGVLHRDLKPENIMLTVSGELRLMDFGIAQWEEDGEQLTKTGCVVGTRHYMAPEQVRGMKVDARTDIYGVGALIYEFFLGRPPFPPHHPDLFSEIMTGAFEDPRHTSMPQALAALCSECLECNRHMRPASVAEVMARLQPMSTAPVSAVMANLGDVASRWCEAFDDATRVEIRDDSDAVFSSALPVERSLANVEPALISARRPPADSAAAPSATSKTFVSRRSWTATVVAFGLGAASMAAAAWWWQVSKHGEVQPAVSPSAAPETAPLITSEQAEPDPAYTRSENQADTVPAAAAKPDTVDASATQRVSRGPIPSLQNPTKTIAEDVGGEDAAKADIIVPAQADTASSAPRSLGAGLKPKVIEP